MLHGIATSGYALLAKTKVEFSCHLRVDCADRIQHKKGSSNEPFFHLYRNLILLHIADMDHLDQDMGKQLSV